MSLWRATYIRDRGEGKFTFAAPSKVMAEVWAWNFVLQLRSHWKDAKLQGVLPVVSPPVQEKLGL